MVVPFPSIKQSLGKLLVFFLFFSYIYEIHYRFLPLAFPVVFGAFALFLYIVSKGVRNKCRDYGWNPVKLSTAFLPLAIFSFITIFLNQSWDFYFIKWYIFFVFKVFACVAMMLLAKKYFSELNYNTIIKILFFCGALQIALSLLMWIVPGTQDMLYKTLMQGALADEALERTAGLRLNGYGTNFFGAGAIHGFILLSSVLLLQNKIKAINNIVGIVLFIFIFAISMMMARTTLIGFAFSLVLLLLIRKPNFAIFKLLIYILCSAAVCILILRGLSPQVLERFDYVITFGFEMFINYFNGEGLSTSSTDGMMRMYVFPDNSFTWLFGDGFWETARGYYYKGTDIGWCRMIFYFGLIGSLIFILCYKNFLKLIYKKSKTIPYVYFCILLLFICILNLKGFIDLFPLIIPLYFCNNKDVLNYT